MVLSKSMASEVDKPLRYMQQLDGLRAIAVMTVLGTHYLPKQYWLLGIYWGSFGVQLFFVLSGFLITGILLKCRKYKALGQSSLFILRQFYLRRFLRLFPLYYTIIALIVIVNIPPVRETVIWHLSYLSNIRFAIQGEFEGAASHFWSLSVEEQFYLIWPFVILFLPRKALLRAILLTVCIAPLFRLVSVLLGLNQIALGVLTPGSLDTLGMGALLAYLLYYPKEAPVSSQKAIQGFFLIGLPITIALQIVACVDYNSFLPTVFLNTGRGLIFAWLVASASIGFKGFAGKILEFPPIVYLGKISYGIYLIHPVVPYLIREGMHFIGLPPDSIPLKVFLLLSTSLTIILASLSWYLLEKPINGFKKNFPYTNALSKST